jgi:hypothetical protein
MPESAMPVFIVEYKTSRDAFAVADLVILVDGLEDATEQARRRFDAICEWHRERPPRGFQIRDADLDVVRKFQLETPEVHGRLPCRIGSHAGGVRSGNRS